VVHWRLSGTLVHWDLPDAGRTDATPGALDERAGVKDVARRDADVAGAVRHQTPQCGAVTPVVAVLLSVVDALHNAVTFGALEHVQRLQTDLE
jgi:hypothetical protein